MSCATACGLSAAPERKAKETTVVAAKAAGLVWAGAEGGEGKEGSGPTSRTATATEASEAADDGLLEAPPPVTISTIWSGSAAEEGTFEPLNP